MKALLLLIAAAPIALAPAAAQTMDHSMHDMPGMQMPPSKPAAKKPVAKKPAARKPAAPKTIAKRPAAKPAPKAKPAPVAKSQPTRSAAPAVDPHAGHEMSGMDMPGEAKEQVQPPVEGAADPHAGHDMSQMPGMEMGPGVPTHGTGGTALPPGNAPEPAPPGDHYADRIYPQGEMARARDVLTREHGGGTFQQIMFNLAEYQAKKGRDGYRWDGEAWFGGDIHRLTLKSEGEGAFRDGLESAEVQALYSRALDPYWNLQAGVRYDFKPNPSRAYATVGIEGLAPYWFEVEGALFLSNKGDVLGRVEGYYDQRITQRWILQPRVELNFAAQDVPENEIGSGLSTAELGLRLRYELAREFAPYIGASYDRKVGDTARFARGTGDDVEETSFVVGVRTWF